MDARTRGSQAPVYGDFECQPALRLRWPQPWLVQRVACYHVGVRCDGFTHQLEAAGTSWALGRSSIAVPPALFSPCEGHEGDSSVRPGRCGRAFGWLQRVKVSEMIMCASQHGRG